MNTPASPCRFYPVCYGFVGKKNHMLQLKKFDNYYFAEKREHNGL